MQQDSKFWWWFGLAAFTIVAVLGVLFWAFFSIVRSVNQGVEAIQQTTENTVGPMGAMTSNMATQVAEFLNPTPTVLPDPVTIITEVQSLARLETIQYSIEKVITAENRQGPLGFLFGDKLLLVAHGEVIAGIDLAKMSETSLRLEGGALFVELPPAEIFVATLNNDKSYIYDRDVGILSKGNIDLESEARRVAEDSIREAAMEDGILEQASRNAQFFLTRLLNDMGYEQVVFTQIEPSEQGVTPVP